ncbi:MAG: ABC transporter ATP-binding protein/permease [Lachnospiraceae bacterium]|nr:ABC transporter ATP-binding protein/permease [Lachnospiraceae bacterium]
MNTINKLKYLLDRKMKIRVFLVSFMIIIGSMAELIGVAIILPIVNLAIDSDFENNMWCKMVINITGINGREKIMLVLISATIAIYILKSFYLSWMNSNLYRFSAVVRKGMAVRLLQAYLKQPYEFFLRKNTSELIRGVNEDTGRFYEVIVNCLLVFSNGLTSLVLLITLIITNPYMALMIAVLLGMCAAVILLGVQKKTRELGKENQTLSGFLLRYLQQTFEGVKEIKVLNNENYFVETYRDTYQRQTDVVRKFSLINLIPKYMIETVCITGIMLYLAVNILYNPDYMKIVPQLAVFVAAAYKLLPSVNALYAYMNTIIYHRAAIDLIYHDIKEVEGKNIDLVYTAAQNENFEFNEKIEISHVDFAYESSEKTVLNDVNIEIPKGKSVAFIGASGGGKTTTADLVLGLLVPCKGKVLVDGNDINVNIEAWRKQIGYIPQSIYLIDGSIKNNIAFGIPEEEIDESSVWEALKEAQLEEFVESLEDGIETEVGERGVRISGGQRQRIGIARALYRNPNVLVFDEATSALDNETEKEVMKAIDSLHGNKTMIIIAHRLSTIENCDMVYRIEKGKVIRER